MSLSRPQYIDYIRTSSLFEGIDPDALSEILGAARPHRIKKGAYFFYQDQPARNLYMLVEGRVKFTQVTANGQQVLLRAVGPGEIFGTVAALSDALHPASAQAATDCVTLAWRGEDIGGLMDRFPRIALNVAPFSGRTPERVPGPLPGACDRTCRKTSCTYSASVGREARGTRGRWYIGRLIPHPAGHRRDVGHHTFYCQPNPECLAATGHRPDGTRARSDMQQ